MDPSTIPFYQARTLDEWGVGIDAVNALDVWGFGEDRGFQGLKLEPGSFHGMGNTGWWLRRWGLLQFPFPGWQCVDRAICWCATSSRTPYAGRNSADDVVTSKANVRGPRCAGPECAAAAEQHRRGRAQYRGSRRTPKGVEIAYARLGKVFRVRAANCILASWNMMIPYLCPDMPAKQKKSLHYLVKIPSGVHQLWRCAISRRSEEARRCRRSMPRVAITPRCTLNRVVDIGGYRSVRSPADPVLLRMVRVPCAPGLDERTQHRLGHADILATSL